MTRPERVSDSEAFGRLRERAEKMVGLAKRRRLAIEEAERACEPGVETCRELTGVIVFEGHQANCRRLVEQPLGCAAGIARYRQAVVAWLKEVEFGDLDQACFHDPGFVFDDVTLPLRAYANEGRYQRGVSLLLAGGTGVGKTFGCLALMGHLAATGVVRGKVYNAHETFSRGIWTDELAEAARAKLILIDDLGLEANTESVKANLTTLLDRRAANGRPTFITTNLSSVVAIASRYGDRILDRLKAFESDFFNLPSKR